MLLARSFVLLAIFSTAWPLAAMAQSGEGARFGGARDPKTCPDHTAPKRGAITPELAAQYVTCEEEHSDLSSLYLIDKMQVQIGKGRSFQILSDSYNDIDSSQPIYPIRGSYVRYSCSVPHAVTGTVGKNCHLIDQPKATGACFKTTFGDWHCFMKDLDNTTKWLQSEIPPPH
jgi:hypothetical protein